MYGIKIEFQIKFASRVLYKKNIGFLKLNHMIISNHD